MFNIENFDAAAWAQHYKDAGAKFAGPVAEHHDGFSMWASKVNRWSAKDMGPHRDVVGELTKEIRARGMKVITSFHHGYNLQGYYTPKEGWDTADPAYAGLYGQFPDPKVGLERWLAKLKEAIDNYQPEQIWFDFGLAEIPDEYKENFAVYYYNKKAELGKQVIITRKGDHLPEGVGVLDIERGRMKGMGAELWQTDDATARNSWCWVQGLDVKPTEEMVHELIDIVSKNGVLLLNVCPKADGTISDGQQALLRSMGDWLRVNGEAIYATRPWETYGEGPNELEKGGSFVGTVQYTADDVRYTRSKDSKALYAICLGWPEKPLTLTAVKASPGANAKVTLLGSDKPVKFKVNAEGQPVLTVPKLAAGKRPSQFAYAFKLEGMNPTLHASAGFSMEEAITLSADKAVLDGKQIRLEKKTDSENIGFWDKPGESVHWLLRIPEAGTYSVRGYFASMNDVSLALSAEKQRITAAIPKSGGFDNPVAVAVGELKFAKPGIHHLVLGAADPEHWSAINVWKLELAPANLSQAE